MRLAVLEEAAAGGTRVAATSDAVKNLTAFGLTVALQAGGGAHASIGEADYEAAGAAIAPDAAAVLQGAEVVSGRNSCNLGKRHERSARLETPRSRNDDRPLSDHAGR